MNYKKKRLKAKLSSYAVARELGCDWNKYKQVEEKNLNLEGQYLDKFLKIIEYKNAKMLKFNYKQEVLETRGFAQQGILRALMEKRGYNQKSLAEVLNVSEDTISKVMNNKYDSDDMYVYVYDFLKNPLNEKIEVKEETKNEEEKYDIDEINRIIKEKGIKKCDIARATNISDTHVINILAKNRRPLPAKLEAIYNYVTKGFDEENKDKSKLSETKLNKINKFAYLLKEKNITRSDIAKTLDINYYYVWNYFQGKTVEEDIKNKIEAYIREIVGEEEFNFNCDELKQIMKDKNISNKDISVALNLDTSYVSKLLNGLYEDSWDTKRKIDDFVRNVEVEITPVEDSSQLEIVFEEDPQSENTLQIEENIVETPIVLDEIEKAVNESENNEIKYIIEQLDNKEVEESEDDYFDLLKENYDLKLALKKAEHQIEMYEILIERLK